MTQLRDFLLPEENTTRLMALQEEYNDKYNALTQEEKQELIKEFEAHKQEGTKICHPTAQACIQDVANAAWNMQLLVSRIM